MSGATIGSRSDRSIFEEFATLIKGQATLNDRLFTGTVQDVGLLSDGSQNAICLIDQTFTVCDVAKSVAPVQVGDKILGYRDDDHQIIVSVLF